MVNYPINLLCGQYMQYKIGIDIDGVLTDEGPRKNSIWQQKMNELFDREIKLKKYTYNLAEAYDITGEELQLFLKEKLPEVYAEVKPALGARETLKELESAGHELILITARNEIFKSLTENWLNKHDIPYHE